MRGLRLMMIICGGVLAWLGGSWQGRAQAHVERSPASGTITVTTQSDSNSSNGVVSLREAILIANGGTGITGLNRLLSTAEKDALAGSGCTIVADGGSWRITGGCGAGVADTIKIPNYLPMEVDSPMPAILDANTIIESNNTSNVRVSAKNMASGNVFTILSNGTMIRRLDVVYLPDTGVAFEVIGGEGVRLYSNTVGLAAPDRCKFLDTDPRGLHGIQIESGVTGSVNSPSVEVIDNEIRCMLGAAIDLKGADYTLIKNNTLGTIGNVTPLGNDGDGLLIEPDGSDGAQYNIVEGNRIGTNGGHGVHIVGTGSNDLTSSAKNVVRGNWIGLYSSDAYNQFGPNAGSGVRIDTGAFNNQIGDGGGESNYIADNGEHGVHIVASTLNGVLGNIIGTSRNGAQGLGNGLHGVYIQNGVQNFVGAHLNPFPAVAGNSIGGSGGDGVRISGGSGNSVLANTIGVHPKALAAPGDPGFVDVGNGAYGVNLTAGATGNTIGSTANSAQGNRIQANTFSGVLLDGTTVSTNTVASNLIQLNGFEDIRMVNGTFGNKIGQIGYGNVLSRTASAFSGVRLSSSAHDNRIEGNTVFGSLRHGIEFTGGATDNLITATVIYGNTGDGIDEADGTTGNYWSRVSIFDNGGLGIDKKVTNVAQDAIDAPYPVITSVVRSGANTTVSGSATAASIFTAGKVEVYRVAVDRSGFGEGKTYVGSAPVTIDGAWSLTFAGAGGCFTAFETRTTSFLGTTTASSEFGPNSCVVYLPVVRRSAASDW